MLPAGSLRGNTKVNTSPATMKYMVWHTKKPATKKTGKVIKKHSQKQEKFFHTKLAKHPKVKAIKGKTTSKKQSVKKVLTKAFVHHAKVGHVKPKSTGHKLSFGRVKK